MKVQCMNSVPKPEAANIYDMAQRVYCGFVGEVEDNTKTSCPRCQGDFTLAQVTMVRRQHVRNEESQS